MVVSVDGRDVADWLDLSAALEAAGDNAEVSLESGQTVTMARSSSWRPADPGLVDDVPARWGLTPTTIFVGDVGETVSKDATDLLAGCRPEVTRPESPAFKAGLERATGFYGSMESWFGRGLTSSKVFGPPWTAMESRRPHAP